jgi:S-DNA-T family DNA segregation ATPase FtsK/SpoIIIE
VIIRKLQPNKGCFFVSKVSLDGVGDTVSKRKRTTKKKKKAAFKKSLQFELVGLVAIALSFVGILKLGAVGKALIYFLRFFIGEWYILGFIGLIALGGHLIVRRTIPPFFHRRTMGVYLIVASLLLFNHVKLFESLLESGSLRSQSVITNTWEIYWHDVREGGMKQDLGGGMIGAVFYALSFILFDTLGTRILSALAVVIGTILITGKSLGETFAKMGKSLRTVLSSQFQSFKTDLSERKERNSDKQKEKKTKQVEEVILPIEPSVQKREIKEPLISNFAERAYTDQNVEELNNHTSQSRGSELEESTIDTPIAPMTFAELENKDYQLPPLSLLSSPVKTDQSSEYKVIQANAAKLERTFESFGVKARVSQVHLGPAVTKYEILPDVGVKVSRIVSLSDDLALALAAKDIRIEAPIPGKSAIGIEVPNSEVAMVTLREVIEKDAKEKPEAKLMIGLGRNISGEAVTTELNKMPHLLVAGATGSGKSVCINGIITSILMRAKPHEVKMMMIDPKMVELNVYNGVPHLLAPVVTDAKKASQALKKVVGEMERRYDHFSHTGTRNIEGYNEFIKKKNIENDEKNPLLPFIVVIVDELADLMMVASNDVEDSIMRLAQMARAAGIHLILATQRPSVDVITGVIKANIPSRIAFAVSSMTDSRTILDMGGAEKLLGRGDMLFLPAGSSKPTRVQGAFLSDLEVEDIVNFVIDQQKAQYQEEMIPDEIVESSSESKDELYNEVVALIADMQTASVSMLQRRFRIGYSRAARLIDEMEANGIVGAYEGSKPRTVLIPKTTEEQSS